MVKAQVEIRIQVKSCSGRNPGTFKSTSRSAVVASRELKPCTFENNPDDGDAEDPIDRLRATQSGKVEQAAQEYDCPDTLRGCLSVTCMNHVAEHIRERQRLIASECKAGSGK